MEYPYSGNEAEGMWGENSFLWSSVDKIRGKDMDCQAKGRALDYGLRRLP